MEPNSAQTIDTQVQASSTAVGPGTLTAQPDAQPSLLDGITEYEWVDLFNPLSVSFVAQVASSRPVNAPVRIYQTPGLESGVRTESDLATQYGITGFKNKEHPSNVHVPHTIEIVSGHTRRLPGNEAQVVLRQIVGYLLQVEGKGLKLADPYERNLAEQRIIRGKGNIADLMTEAPVSIPEQLTRAVDKSNAREEEHRAEPETAFPGVPRPSDSGGVNSAQQSTDGDPNRPKA